MGNIKDHFETSARELQLVSNFLGQLCRFKKKKKTNDLFLSEKYHQAKIMGARALSD